MAYKFSSYKFVMVPPDHYSFAYRSHKKLSFLRVHIRIIQFQLALILTEYLLKNKLKRIIMNKLRRSDDAIIFVLMTSETETI